MCEKKSGHSVKSLTIFNETKRAIDIQLQSCLTIPQVAVIY